MKEIRVASFAELHRALHEYQRSNLWLFRGQGEPEWRLVPKAGRGPFAAYDDSAMFEAWERRSAEFLTSGPLDVWDALAAAQHHGLATRLLDWSFNPLVAAFFAAWENLASDAVVFAYYSSRYVEPREGSPFDFEGVRRFKPRGVAQRITRQSGIFTVHGPAEVELEKALGPGDTLEKIIIDRGYRSQLLFDLSFYGVNRLTLFPDLDGLAAHMNWATANREFWAGRSVEELEEA